MQLRLVATAIQLLKGGQQQLQGALHQRRQLLVRTERGRQGRLLSAYKLATASEL